ncbi:hypothetical protein BLSTO_01730 [Blastocystis sp. subtype 1]
MNRAIGALKLAEKGAEEAAKLQFHSRPRPSFSVRAATPKDLKWMEEQQFASRKEITTETMIEEILRLIKTYGLDEFTPMIQTIQLQYKNIQDQISLYKEQLHRYEGDGRQAVIAQKRAKVMQSFKVRLGEEHNEQEEESMIQSEIHSYEQTIATYIRKQLATLRQEQESLERELASVQSVLSRYEDLQKQNQRLVDAIASEKDKLNALREERRRTLDNVLTDDECAMSTRLRIRATELEKKRAELDASERDEAALMVEMEGLLKGKDTSLSLNSSLQSEDVETHIKRLEKRHLLMRHVCEEYVTEGKECGNSVAIAMEILFRNGGDMLLSDLKNEMKKVIQGNPSAVLSTIYSLVGNQIIRIDRSTKEQRVICLVSSVCGISVEL